MSYDVESSRGYIRQGESMKKFLVLYFCSLEEQMAVSQETIEQRENGMKLWFAWKEKLGSKLVDFGTPLFGGITINQGGLSKPSALELSGFSMIQAEDMDEAKSLVENHPHFTYGSSCQVEVHELMEMGM